MSNDLKTEFFVSLILCSCLMKPAKAGEPIPKSQSELSLHPRRLAADRHFQRGRMLFELGRFEDAARELQAARAGDTDPTLIFDLAQAYRKGRRYAEAIETYLEFLRASPNDRLKEEARAHIEDLSLLLRTPLPAPLPRAPLWRRDSIWLTVAGVVAAIPLCAAIALAAKSKEVQVPDTAGGVIRLTF